MNLAGQPGFPAQIAAEFDSKVAVLGSCTGPACNNPPADPSHDLSFKCHSDIQEGQEVQGSFNFKVNEDGTPRVIRGWAVNFFFGSGFSPLEVRMRMDQHFLGERFEQIANMTRPDLNRSSGVLAQLPNLEHGFEFKVEDLPAEALIGKHEFDVMHAIRDSKGKLIETEAICNPQCLRCLCEGIPCDCNAVLEV